MRKHKFTNISFEGTRDEINAMAAIARKRNVPVGTLVRNAVVGSFGAEIEKAISFFAIGEQQITQAANESTSQSA